MVFRSVSETENSELSGDATTTVMASSTTVKPHHQPLHNFPLQDLKWSMNHSSSTNGNNTNHHHQRVRKSSSDRSPLRDAAEKKKPLAAAPVEEENAADKKAKIFIRLRTKGNCSGKSGSGDEDGANAAEDQSATVVEESEEVVAKTWNLRPRRAVTKPGPNGNNGGGGGGALKINGGGGGGQDSKVQSRSELTRSRNGNELKVNEKKEEKKQKFSLSLTKEEIEEDIFILTGSKPVRRPKKRARHVQKLLDNVFPGLWLSSITPDSYRVDPPTKG